MTSRLRRDARGPCSCVNIILLKEVRVKGACDPDLRYTVMYDELCAERGQREQPVRAAGAAARGGAGAAQGPRAARALRPLPHHAGHRRRLLRAARRTVRRRLPDRTSHAFLLYVYTFIAASTRQWRRVAV